jgi:hypothetical protein
MTFLLEQSEVFSALEGYKHGYRTRLTNSSSVVKHVLSIHKALGDSILAPKNKMK